MVQLESKLAGYIGVAIMVLGLATSIAPSIIPFIPPEHQSAFSAIIVMLGGLKSWLALNPFSQIVVSPALVASNARNVTVAPAGDVASPNTTTRAAIPTTQMINALTYPGLNLK